MINEYKEVRDKKAENSNPVLTNTENGSGLHWIANLGWLTSFLSMKYANLFLYQRPECPRDLLLGLYSF